VSQFLGSNAAEENTLQLYPNPSTGLVQLQAAQLTKGPARVRVLNVLGQVVLEQTVADAGPPSQWQLDLSQQPAGLYLVQLKPGSQSFTQRLVLQR
jgi:hypothetical protein